MHEHVATYGVAHKDVEFATDRGDFHTQKEWFAPYVCEFVGAFMLALTAGCCAFANNPMWNPTAIASAFMVLVYAFGPISGGHLNPAVSITLGLCGKVKWLRVVSYATVQIVASLLACAICNLVFRAKVSIGPVGSFTMWPAAVVEVVYTAMLCFVFANCVASHQNNPNNDRNQFFALAIGFVFVAGGYASGGVSGAIFNPAVAIGLDIATPGDGIGNGFVYALYEVLGAIVAAVLFACVRPEEFTRSSQDKQPFGPKVLSEFLGTFVLVLTVCLNIVMNTAATPWSAAAALMCMMYSLGNVSGGHFNPAVSLAVVLCGRMKCSPRDGIAYAFAQGLAAIVASLVASFVQAGGPNGGTIGLGPQEGHSWGEAFLAELLFTFLIVYIVLAVATTALPSPSSNNFYFALAIGSCITAGGFASGAISGGTMNPAVALGIATEGAIKFVSPGAAQSTALIAVQQEPTTTTAMSGPRPWINCIYYSVFQLLGGVLAASVFHITHAYEFIKGANPLP